MTTTLPIAPPETPLLDVTDTPERLRALDRSQLQTFVDELRAFLLYTVGQTGGHFAAGLGVVELTVALHYVFDTPDDRLVWDVGHQSYPHKIITGRRHQMPTLRQQDGLKGFPSRQESDFDTFGVGHSSTSISAALGMALASKLRQEERHSVAVIGDGAMTAGMAFEALNHAADCNANLLVVLNDNFMSISENVGGLSNYFARICSSRTYNTLRKGGKKVLKNFSAAQTIVKKTEEHVKGMVSPGPGALFEELGFNYIGPVNGHDVMTLVDYLQRLKELPGPRLFHVITQKGHGFSPAEQDPIKYHALSKNAASLESASDSEQSKPVVFEEGIEKATQPIMRHKPQKYSSVFGNWLCELAAVDAKVVAITPAMKEGSGLVEFATKFPDRFYDVAIAEQHSVTLAAGLACEGIKPVVAIYSTFLQRAYDQLIHDIAIQNLNVLFAIDRAGLVGEDGPTHAGCFDITFLRCVPNMIIMAPSDENECHHLLYTGYCYDGPAAVRYPRGNGTGAVIDSQKQLYPIGKARIVKDRKVKELSGQLGSEPTSNERIVFLGFGSMVSVALAASVPFDSTVVDMRFIKPIDEELIKEMALSHDLVVTVEENMIAGGAGSLVNEVLHQHAITASVLNLGLPDQNIEQGSQQAMLREVGLDVDGIIASVKARLLSKGK